MRWPAVEPTDTEQRVATPPRTESTETPSALTALYGGVWPNGSAGWVGHCCNNRRTMAIAVPWALSHAQVVIEVVATLAFALSGVIEGARKRLDAVGICVVAGLAAFGGGTVRDVLLDRRPLFWMQHAGWIWVLLALCVAAMVFMRARHLEPTERAMQWPDALGLGRTELFPVIEPIGALFAGSRWYLNISGSFAKCDCIIEECFFKGGHRRQVFARANECK
jgi:hypothetical protein